VGSGLQIGGALGSRRARRRSAQPMSEINVTPMVDVMLVLLIIFMVTAPMLTVGLNLEPQPDLPKVDLPKTEAGPVDAQKQVLAITVDPTGKVFLQSTEIGFDELVPKLTAIRESGAGGDRVEVRGDDRAQYGSVAKVLARIKAAGIPVTLVTEAAEGNKAQ
jgi:biopolymer transport protein TolR